MRHALRKAGRTSSLQARFHTPSAHVVALNTAHVLRLNKADVVALNKAHVLRLNSELAFSRLLLACCWFAFSLLLACSFSLLLAGF